MDSTASSFDLNERGEARVAARRTRPVLEPPQDEMGQERSPYLPFDRVFVLAVEVLELERLLEFLFMKSGSSLRKMPYTVQKNVCITFFLLFSLCSLRLCVRFIWDATVKNQIFDNVSCPAYK